MKTANFKSFAKEEIKEKEMNCLKGGGLGDPVEDIVIPPIK